MISIPQRLLGEALLLSAKNNSRKTAIIDNGFEYSYGALKECAKNFAGYLIKVGIRKGDRVAIYMDNSWHSAISIYGITLSGAVFLVINPQTKADKLKYILHDCDAKILVSANKLKRQLDLALNETENIK